MARVKCPHCGKEVTTKWSTFSMLMPVQYSLNLRKIGTKSGVSVSSLVNQAILAVKKTDSLPLSPPSNMSVGYNLSNEALEKAKKIAEERKLGVRAVVRSAVALMYFNKQ
jgi:hypothetical protein